MIRPLVMVIALMLFNGCTPPLHVAVVYDVSGSTQPNDQAVRTMFKAWLQEALDTGGSFTVYVVGASYGTTTSIFHCDVPTAWKAPVSRSKAAFIHDAQEGLAKALKTAGIPKNGSAIAEAICLAVTRLQEARQTDPQARLRLCVASDLRQVTLGKWNFEQKIPSPQAFCDWLARERMAADLTGIETYLEGVHHYRFAPSQEADLRAVWETALKSMGAPVVVIRSSSS
jgi:hypothetical protein